MSNMNNLTPHTIAQKFVDPGFELLSLTEQVKLLGISRGSLYYQPQPVGLQTLDILNRIDKIHTDWPTFGARKIAAQLTREFRAQGNLEFSIGRKHVRTLMERMGIEAIYPKPNLSKNNLSHPVYPYLLSGLTITRPNQVWGADITYIKMHGGFLYLVAFIDWYSRFIVGFKLSTSLEAEFVLEAAEEARLTYGDPGITNVDQGVQFTSNDFINLWDKELTQISMDHKGRCFDNIFTERFWRSLKYEEVYLKDYQSVHEAKRSISDYINRYNFDRIHEALGYKTPAEIYFNKTNLDNTMSQMKGGSFV